MRLSTRIVTWSMVALGALGWLTVKIGEPYYQGREEIGYALLLCAVVSTGFLVSGVCLAIPVRAVRIVGWVLGILVSGWFVVALLPLCVIAGPGALAGGESPGVYGGLAAVVAICAAFLIALLVDGPWRWHRSRGGAAG